MQCDVDQARTYLATVNERRRPKKSLDDRFPAASEEVMDLLRAMLQISPEQRISVRAPPLRAPLPAGAVAFVTALVLLVGPSD